MIVLKSLIFISPLISFQDGVNAFSMQKATTFAIGNVKNTSVRTPYGTKLHTTTFDPSSTSQNSQDVPFQDFDYNAHWYPVIWACDLQIQKPTKVTVFDVDYVVAKISDNEVIAMEDACPHKAAALSQGRVTSTGRFQCAYHGWSFDGNTGECVEIPQIVETEKDVKIPNRACATAVPAQIHQGMVWLFPGGGLEEALQADPPPTIEECEGEKPLKMSYAIRDMPIDWPILVSNILDPDHGVFAHQNKAFDMYTASKVFPFESFESKVVNKGKGWTLKAKVDSQDKLLEVDRTLRSRSAMDDTSNPSVTDTDLAETTKWATSYFHAPNHIQLKRVDKETGISVFNTVFYVCPVGVGRSRFMSAAAGKSATPRWLVKLFLDNFLDQDTYLLATQQQHILSQEAADLRQLVKTKERKDIRMSTRRRLFCLASPTEKIGSKIESFWDETLARSPNRIENLLKLDEAGAFLKTPSREVVLDRKAQNLDICKDSQDVVRNCRIIRKASRSLLLLLACVKFVSAYPPQLVTKPTLFGLQNWGILGMMKNLLLKSSGVGWFYGLLFMASFLAKRLEREYYFKYTDDYRHKDLAKISKIWLDK
jgi:phenylpropionate dioxygenase-like ring-hydroxylating dioxygenase large terminal subunit